MDGGWEERRRDAAEAWCIAHGRVPARRLARDVDETQGTKRRHADHTHAQRHGLVCG